MNMCGNCGDAKDANGLCSCPIGSKEVYSKNAKLRAEVERLKDAHGQGELNERLKDPVEYAKVAIAGCALKIEELELQVGVLNGLLDKIAEGGHAHDDITGKCMSECGVCKVEAFRKSNDQRPIKPPPTPMPSDGMPRSTP